jgi:hypothetical protein
MISKSKEPYPTHILLKLVSGELVMSRFDSETESEYVVEYPMIANRYYDEDSNNFQAYLTSLNPFDDVNILFTLDKKHVIFVSNMEQEVVTFYENNVSMRYQSSDHDQSLIPIGSSIH